MASSGKSTVEITKWNRIVFSWWFNSGDQNPATNTTLVRWKMELTADPGGRIISGAQKTWIITVDGKEYTGKNTVGCDINQTILLASGTTSVKHTSTSSQPFSYTFWQELWVDFSSAGYGVIKERYGSGTGVLDAIPQKSELTVPNGTLGVLQAVTVLKKSDSYKHTIRYSCGSKSGTICDKVSDIYVNWTPPLELATQSPQYTSVTVNFTIETFNGSTSVGTNTATAVYQMDNRVNPYMATTLSDASGWYDIIGAYVQGQSKLKLVINANGSYGASIASITTIFDGSNYTGTPVTTNPILQTGTVKASITAKDSRGRTVTEEPTISVLAYSYPKLTALSAYRSDATHMTVKFSSSVTSLNKKNGAWYKVQYKKSTESNYTTVDLSGYTGNFAVTNGTYTFEVTDSSYDINVLVGDRFKTITYTTTGPSAKHDISMLKKNGKIVGMAVGKVAEHEGYFDLGFKLKCSGGGDSVVEEGEANGWRYRKWDSGDAECWKTLAHSTTVATAWGSMYVGNATKRQNYPFSFVEKPVEIVSITSGSKMGFLYPEQSGYGVNGTSASAQYNVASLSSYTTAVTYYFNYHVMGRWK